MRDQLSNVSEAGLSVEVESQNSLLDVPGAMTADVPDKIREDMEERCPKRKFPKVLKFWRKRKKPVQPNEIVEPIKPTQVPNNDLITKIWEAKKKVLLQVVENLRKRVLTMSDGRKVEEYGVVAAVREENEVNTDEEFVPFMVSPHTGAIMKSVRLRVKKQPNFEDVSNVPCTLTDLEGECANLNRCEPEDAKTSGCMCRAKGGH